MRTLSVVFLASLAIVGAGCGDKAKPKDAEVKSAYDTGLKDLVKEDVVVGKPTKFFPKMKPAKFGDRVFVRYKGTFLSDGVEFDSNIGPDKAAYSFVLGAHEVIEGWDKGIVGMYPGGKRKLKIPYKMAYGPEGDKQKIPAKADLAFDVEVIDVINGEAPNGYGIFEVTKGTGAEAKSGSTVTVQYELRVAGEDTLFDSSETHKIKPEFKIGSEKAWPGVEDGIIGMKVGGVREIWLPPTLSPTGRELEGFPPNAITIFKITLLSVK